jgi:hypothetical protein
MLQINKSVVLGILVALGAAGGCKHNDSEPSAPDQTMEPATPGPSDTTGTGGTGATDTGGTGGSGNSAPGPSGAADDTLNDDPSNDPSRSRSQVGPEPANVNAMPGSSSGSSTDAMKNSGVGRGGMGGMGGMTNGGRNGRGSGPM